MPEGLKRQPRILTAAALVLMLLATAVQARLPVPLLVGVLADFPPHYSLDAEGKPTGFAIEAFETLIDSTGIEFRYEVYATWPDLHRALRRGDIDVIPNMGITDARRGFAAFTAPIEVFSLSVFAREDSGFQTLDDLSGHQVAVVATNAAIPLLRARGDYELREYPHFTEALQALMAGRVDAVAYPAPVVRSTVVEFGIEDRIRELMPPLKEIRRGIAVARDHKVLLELLNRLATDFTGGERYGDIYTKWFGQTESPWTVRQAIVVFLAGVFLSAVVTLLLRYRHVAGLVRRLRQEAAQREKAEAELLRLNFELEERVRTRTKDLARRTSELEKSQSRFQALFDNLSAAIIVHGPDSAIRYMNPVASRLLSLADDRLEGRLVDDPHWHFVGEDGRPLVVEDYPVAQILAHQRPITGIVLGIVRSDGAITDTKWVLVNGAPLQDADGHVEEVLISFVDITAIREADRKLERAAKVFASTTEGVTITDADANIIDVNEAFTEVTGYAREEVIGENPGILKSGRHDEAFYRAMWQSLLDNGSWRGEIWNRRKDGTIYPEFLSISAIRDTQGRNDGYVAVFADITQAKDSEQQLEFLAHHDALTKLPNRLLLNARLELALQRALRHGRKLAVIFLDVDRFKGINDSMGHLAGDRLLEEIATRLGRLFRDEDTVARISGDEFVVLVEDVADRQAAAVAAQKAREAFHEPFRIGDAGVRVTASCGVSLYPDAASDMQALLTRADMAMYQSKESGRDAITFYGADQNPGKAQRVRIEVELRSALPRSEFSLAYQPQIDTASKKLVGLEALIRWRHPEHGLIPPSDFIPIAEEAGFIRELGIWVLSEAARQARKWARQGVDVGRVAVNISGAELRTADFEATVQRVLADNDLAPERLELEVTEHFAIRRDRVIVDRLRALQAIGITIAVDDFGTGYSSFAHLRELPVDKLKIDRSFIKDTPEDKSAAAIVESIVAMGKILGLRVVAEGIETRAQMHLLGQIGCPEAQGYFIARPLEADRVEDWLADWTRRQRQGSASIHRIR
jgi:diguanylate cyclase (GGDEF)-like protein/PAS domain S-box-containing protein